MVKGQSDQQNFSKGALGYFLGTLAGIIFIIIIAQLNLMRSILGLIDESQLFLRVLSIPLLAGLMLSIAGAILGGIGGWFLGGIVKTPKKTTLVIGSGLAFAISTSLLTLIFLLLLSFIGLYNNLSSDRIQHYGLLFGLFGLIFGLLTGLLQALLTVRMRHLWRVLLASILGFGLGGVLLGLLVRFLNPTVAFKTYPWLTFLLLALGLTLPFLFGGGLSGFVYGRLARLANNQEADVAVYLYPSKWQIALVGLAVVTIAITVFSQIGQIAEFLVIHPGNLQSQISPVSVGVHWHKPIIVTDRDFEDENSERVEFVDEQQTVHAAWCDADGSLYYQIGNTSPEQIPEASCNAPPAVILDLDGSAHLVWHTSQIVDNFGNNRSASVLVESIRLSDGWSDPLIIVDTNLPVRPYLSFDTSGNIQLDWQDTRDGKDVNFQTIQERYECNPDTLLDIEKAGLEVMNTGNFRPAGALVPYCRNRYNRIVYTPNPEPVYSNVPVTENGAFDQVSNTASIAQYEVLFATMQWESNDSPPSPGFVLATEVAKLYNQVKQNPENYPRGMTIRILLGNYPVMSNFQWGSQIMDVLTDLRDAGVETMLDPEIGWRLEVANFPGTYPHSHTKFLIVDGKIIMSAGFNYGYLHLPANHPSGRGYDMLDLGLIVTGPIAQDGISVFDDLWTGADQIHCDDFYPDDNSDWKKTCSEQKAISDHVPEVTRYYLTPEGNSNTFSLYRSQAYKEADEFIYASLASANQSVDMMQVNFSLEMICMVNLVSPDLCTFNNALPYMVALLDAIEENQVKVRVMMENTNSNGLENRIGAIVFMNELESRGLADLVDLRFYDGKIHAKSTLIDDKLLIIGSQNMHYSSWGTNGLTEYSLTTDDPKAISEYKNLFETKWQEAIPFEEAEYGSSP